MRLRSGRCWGSDAPPVDRRGRTRALSIVRTRILTRLIHALMCSVPTDTEARTLMGVDAWTDVLDHLERHFQPNMSWSNIRQWDLDHALPIAAFDLSDPVHRRACFHVTNLRPMWWWENKKKGTRYDPCEWNRTVRRFEREVASV